MSDTKTCAVCSRDPDRVNSHVAECSVVECPHRRRAWSERPTGRRYPETTFRQRDIGAEVFEKKGTRK